MTTASRDPVAIVGYGCVLPDAEGPSAFWQNVVNRTTALRPLQSPVFKAHYAASGDDSYFSLVAAQVQKYVFDWRRFRIPPNEAVLINPMQLMTLDAGAQALSSVKQLPRERTGLILGATGFGWQRDSGMRIRARDMMQAVSEAKAFSALAADTRKSVSAATLQKLDAELAAVSEDNVVNASASVACGRIAMAFDLKGVHYSVDAGFASALAALDVAMSLLHDRTLDLVVSGGASELLSPLELAAFAKLGGLAKNDLRAFDAEANGTLLGEGVALFALKRLDDALADGEKIHAVLHAVAGSTDSAKHGLMAPNFEGQHLAMSRAWEESGRDPASASFIECHATGTPIGDASEVSALALLVEHRPKQPILLGSAKPMVGHCRAAAGAVGLLRAVMALEHRLFPAQLGFAQASPVLELQTRPFKIPTEAVPLPASGELFCGVSAFGFGGINYHAVVSSGAEPIAARAARGKPSQEPIAIVGLGGKFPGAENVTAFWQRLLDGYDATRNIPIERWDVERYFDADRDRKDTCYTRLGCFLDKLPEADPHWRIPPAALASLDPSQLLLLHAAEEALNDSRLDAATVDKRRVSVQLAFLPYQGKKFLADSRMHWRYFSAWLADALREASVPASAQRALLDEAEARYKRDLPPINEDTLTGYLGSVGAARIARTFGFNGPHYVVDSACASTHAALDASVRALRLGQVDMAVSGGVWCDMMPEFFVAACRFQALSAIGSRPFCEGADGFIPGEGAGIFVLRRLSDAERDQQKIYALLRSISGSSDGKGRSVLAPTVQGEGLAMRRAIEASGVAPETIDYVECHGTGTALGDVVETQALQDCYGPSRQRPLLIGSVKSNIGHLNAAAGAAALMKTTLALHHGVLPASLKANPLSSKIGFDKGLIEVVRETRAWPDSKGRPRRAAVSGFGVGGSNLHMIVEQYVSPVKSAHFGAGATAEAAIEALASGAATSGPMRAAIVARDQDTLEKRIAFARDLLRKRADLTVLRKQGIFVHEALTQRLCLTFPGQGPQYANMARELVQAFAPARAMIERLDAAYLQLSGRALSPAFWTDDATGYRQNDEDIHCAVFAVSCAIAAVLKARGLHFDAVLGQSAGMYSALVAAEVLTAEEGLRAVRERTRSVLALVLDDPGKMLYLSCSAEHALSFMRDAPGFVTIAADNGPSACIVSGETPAIAAVFERAKASGAEAEILPVSHAYHSKVIAKAADGFAATLAALRFRAPSVDVFSSVDGRCVAKGAAFDWMPHLLAQFSEPVRMPQAVRAAHDSGCRVFVECGPKWPLTSFVEEILAAEKTIAIATLHPKVGEHEQMQRALAELQTLNCFHEEMPMTQHKNTEVPSLAGLLERARQLRRWLENLQAPQANAPAPIAAAVSAPLPTPTAAPVPMPVAAKPASDTWTDIQQRLLKETSSKTGYPADMLEMDLDLEADLGIDTVKQLAIVSGVRAALDLEVDPRFKLRDFRTLRALTDHLAQRLAGVAAGPQPAVAASASSASAASPRSTAAPAPNSPPQAHAEAPAALTATAIDIRHRLVREAVQRTGYPSDMLELDLDLEADLGIDTVKQLAIVSAVRKELGLEVDATFKLRDFRTLQALIDHFAARVSTPAVAFVAPSQTETNKAIDLSLCQKLAEGLYLSQAALPLGERLSTAENVVIYDLWRSGFSGDASAAIVRTSIDANGERVQWAIATQPIFECVVRNDLSPLEGKTVARPIARCDDAPVGLQRWSRDQPGLYVAELVLDASGGATALLDALFAATALCWGEAHGERTIISRAQELRLDRRAWQAGGFFIEIELAAAPAGTSRARAAVYAEDGSLVCACAGLQGEWPSAAGDAALGHEAWQTLRATARGKENEETK